MNKLTRQKWLVAADDLMQQGNPDGEALMLHLRGEWGRAWSRLCDTRQIKRETVYQIKYEGESYLIKKY